MTSHADLGADARTALSHRPGFIVTLTGALYFAQGLPLGVAFSAYPTILRESGALLTLLAWLPLLGLPWALKFLWSPVVDNHWTASLGRRRTWLLSQQVLIIATMLAAAAFPMTASQAPTHFTLFALASLFSATQDIATDGLAAERLEGRDLLRANALAVSGMMLGMLAGGGGLLVLAGSIGVTWGLFGVSSLLVVCAVPTWLWREQQPRQLRRARASLLALRRPGFWGLLTIAATFAAAHSAEAALAKAALVDRGWTLSAIGWLETASQASMLALGCGAASSAVRRFGPWACVAAAEIVLGCASAAWLATTLGWAAPDGVIVVIRLLSAAGMGLACVAAFTAMMLFAHRGGQAGTDVSAFKSANVLGEIVAASLGTSVAAAAGYPAAFACSVAMAALAFGASLRAARRNDRKRR
ncbi:MAG TPA: MFS transporter [Hansschlegelia sp.]